MAWDQKAVNVTIKAIGEVESAMRYDAINYNDPITVGVAQWYGQRAAALLKKMATADPGRWANVPASIRNDVNNVSSSSDWWTSRYLTRAEGRGLSAILLANKDIQNAQFADDVNGYVQVAESWNYDKDTMTQAVQFFCTMYHQAPARSLDVTQATPWPPTLNTIHATAMANPVLGQYPTRLNTVKQIIENNDSTGVDSPPDVDPPTETDPNDPNNPVDPPVIERTSISLISAAGDSLVLKMGDDSVLAFPDGKGNWVPRENAFGGRPADPDTDDPGTTPPPDPDPDPDPPTSGWANPVKSQNCTQAYGRTQRTNYHSGIDIGATRRGVPGDTIYAIHDAQIINRGGHWSCLRYNSGYQMVYYIGLDGGERTYIFINHLDARNPFIAAKGASVKAGDPIARMGGSGRNHSNGDFAVHLHMVGVKGVTWPTDSPATYGENLTFDLEPWLKSKGLMQNMNACPRSW